MNHKERHLAEMLTSKPGILTYMARLEIAKRYATKVNTLHIVDGPKYQIGTLVYVQAATDENHYRSMSDVYAIVAESTETQGEHKYALVVLNGKSEPCNRCAWVPEDQLLLIDEDPELGLLLINTYART